MSDAVANALAGAGGGMASMALTYPLTTVSTRSQVSKTSRISQIEAFKKILKEEGVAGLYSGINSAMFGIAVTQYIYYYWYEFVKSAIQKTAEGRALTIGENMLTGAIAGAFTATITNPIWVLNTRLVVKKDSLDEDGNKPTKRKSSIETAMSILREEGLLGFFRGLKPALILVINPVIQFTVFERIKGWMEKRKSNLTGLDFFLMGAVGKLCATAITYPYIVVKSRMQLKDSADDQSRYTSIADGFSKILKAEGVIGLYKGIESKLVQSVLSSAFTFSFKEQLFSSAVWLLVLLNLREKKLVTAKS